MERSNEFRLISFMPELFLRYLWFKEYIVQIIIYNPCLLVPLAYGDAHGIEKNTHIYGQKRLENIVIRINQLSTNISLYFAQK